MEKTVWLFGLSGAGKTTLAVSLLKEMEGQRNVILLDGDRLRRGINSNLGFSKEDRRENVRRIAEVCKLLMQVGVMPIVAAITPYQNDRRLIESIIGRKKISWIYVKCSLQVCELRDPKGLYVLARKGVVPSFTGVSDSFEPPILNGMLVIDSESEEPVESVKKIFEMLQSSIV